MSAWDKDLIANLFLQPGDKNMKCTILVATDAYGIGINNLNIKLVMQWDFSITFDAMIQQLRRVGRKGGLSTFILFTPKWSQIRDPKKIKNRATKNATISSTNPQLFNTNRPKYSSFFAQITILAKTIFSDTKSILESDAKAKDNKEGEINDSELLSALFAIESKITSQTKASKKQKNQSKLQKRANLPYDFFEYIYRTPC